METSLIKKMLGQVQAGELSVDAAVERLRVLPYEDLGFAKVDHHRALRAGFPEVILCPGKTLEQIEEIFKALSSHNKRLLLTRAEEAVYSRIKAINPKAEYHRQARTIVVNDQDVPLKGQVSVVCAGTADIPVAEEAVVTAEMMGSRVVRVYDVGVAGIHRLLGCFDQISSSRCIIVVAGMDGALASVIGGLVSCPVVGVPTSVGYGSNFNGIAPLLTMLNSCASNVTVVNIDNGFGAGFVAALFNRSCDGNP
ncbi:MAG TPA: nickel pincer cofactor biosynthesis protein LarB [Candidatus Omnitrophota bacterium]|nr:nickel pincer cofactor biosynthesis protein LarB [Candidatus Omnitrophota bacterium]HPN55385.1 nickel pincer cofactor biosynthesis protein LarB [Candidatus Omnitrophota bacterium]